MKIGQIIAMSVGDGSFYSYSFTTDNKQEYRLHERLYMALKLKQWEWILFAALLQQTIYWRVACYAIAEESRKLKKEMRWYTQEEKD